VIASITDDELAEMMLDAMKIEQDLGEFERGSLALMTCSMSTDGVGTWRRGSATPFMVPTRGLV
jgi:hypothetical protein